MQLRRTTRAIAAAVAVSAVVMVATAAPASALTKKIDKLTSTAGCHYHIEGTITYGLLTTTGFVGTVRVTGDGPACNGLIVFNQDEQGERTTGGLTADLDTPAASARTAAATPTTAPAPHVRNQQVAVVPHSDDGEQQASMSGGVGSLLLSLLACTGNSGDDGHPGVTGDTGDTGAKDDEESTDDSDPYGECEQPASGGSGG